MNKTLSCVLVAFLLVIATTVIWSLQKTRSPTPIRTQAQVASDNTKLAVTGDAVAPQTQASSRAARRTIKRPIDPNNLAKISRMIGTEPDYSADLQRYYLLIFDEDEEKQTWVVLDGSTLYVDCNRNGDLTDEGESFRSDKEHEFSFQEFDRVEILGADDETTESLQCMFATLGSASGGFHSRFQVTWRGTTYGAWGDHNGQIESGRTAAEAPILRFNGPLQMGFEVPRASAIEWLGNNEFKINTGVGTPGLGAGSFVHLKYWKGGIPIGPQPHAVIEFPAENPEQPRVRKSLRLAERC